MTQQNSNKSWDILYHKYPDFFLNKNKKPTESCMSFGIECGLGWYDILSSLCWKIKQHEDSIIWQTEWNQKTNPEYRSEYFTVKFDQIKEKFGGLRIYFSGGDEYVEGLVSMAEEFSYKICEDCGERGKPNSNGWIATLCDNCRKE
jgi:hypothetical protein